MADYFTKFSLVFSLHNEVERTYALDLAQKARSAQQGDDLPKHFPTDLVDAIEDWNFETDAGSDPGDWTLWLHSEYGGIDAVFAFIQHLLQKFDPKGRVSFEWSHDCTKPRVDAYGGGAAVITATNISTLSTAEWLRANTACDKRTGREHLFSPYTEVCVRCGQSAADDVIENTPCRVP